VHSTGAKEWWATKTALFAIMTTVAFATAGVMIALAQAVIMDPPAMTPGPGATVAVSWLPVAPVGSNLTTYTLSWDTDPAFPATHTVVTTDLSTTIAGVDGVTYYAVVQADDGSHVLSDPSAVAQATADGVRPVSSFAAVPASPDGLNGWYKSVPTASMSIVDTGTGLQSFVVNTVDVSADPGLTFGLPPDPSTYVVPALGQGLNSFSFFATDVAGNIESPPKTATVSVDSVVPTCSVSAAANVAHITAGDPVPGSGVNHIDYVFLPTGSSPDAFTVWTSVAGSSVTSTSPPGLITVFARSVDTAGNVSSIQQAAMTSLTTITFNSNGGSAVTAITQAPGSAVSAPTAPTKAGSTFAGWFSDAGLTTPYTFTTMPAADITLYAKWTVNTTTITFNSNGGSAVTAITQAPGSAVSAPTAPTKAGSTFAGWFSDAGLTTPYTFTTMPAADITLYAKWTASTFTLTYTAGAHGGITGTSPQTVDYGGNGTLVTAVPSTGYHFVSWSDGVTTAARTDTNVTASKNVSATFAFTLIPTKLTMNANHTSVLRGHLVHFFGVIQPNMPNGTPIAFLVRKAGTIRWVRAVPYVRTFNGYHWSYYYHPSKAGIYYIKVRFSATSTFAAVNSRTVKVTWR